MWEIKKHIQSGSQGAHSHRTAPTKEAAINHVLNSLPWQEDANHLRYVMQESEPCYEDQAVCDLDDGHFAYSQGESTVTYRIWEV